MNATEKLGKAKAIVVMDEPFFASILLKRKLQCIPNGTFAVNARAQIYYCPEFVDKLTVKQVVFALVHECLHVVKLDFIRKGARNARRFNKAGDAWINNYLKKHSIGEPIDKCINCNGGQHIDADIAADTTETIYDRIEEEPDNNGEGSGDYGIGDDLNPDGEGMSESETSEIEAKVKVEIAQAAQAARMMGKMPADMQRVVDEVLTVRTPWETILERFMTEVAKAETSWNKPNKKYRPLGMYMPSTQSVPTMAEMTLIVDVSGSIQNKELAYFSGHFNRIAEMCKPEKINVLYVDTRVAHVDTFEVEDYPVTLTPHGGGGTDMRAGFKWVKENAPDSECVVLLTDGYTPWPEKDDVVCPVIVLCTTDSQCPFETVRFTCE